MSTRSNSTDTDDDRSQPSEQTTGKDHTTDTHAGSDDARNYDDKPSASKKSIRIPKIPPIDDNSEEPMQTQELEGKYVDEFGNILDWDGTVLGRVEGDLPSMIGRPVTKEGQVFSSDGDVVGHVSEVFAKTRLQEIDRSLTTDDAGNIYDKNHVLVGRLNAPQQKKAPNGEQDGEKSEEKKEPRQLANPSPSDICLDVKSTRDGIQLIIRIPTVFNK